jgi:hypothetical protein
MVRITTNWGIGMSLLLIANGLLAALGPVTARAEDADQEVKRFDPLALELVVVPAAEVQPGKIYSHYSKRLGFRVWALAREDGTFSHALGEGTTQPTIRFDLPYSTEQQMEMVAAAAPRWAKAMEQIGSNIHVRLGADQKWKLVQHVTIPSVYDLETQRRWEWHGDRRVAVGHTAGYRWLVEAGRYQPASHMWYGTAPQPTGGCGCSVY